MKVLDVTEFYSQRGGGGRSHLTLKGHILCQRGHDHVVVAPGPTNETTPLLDEGGESSRSKGAGAGVGAKPDATTVVCAASPVAAKQTASTNVRKILKFIGRGPSLERLPELRADSTISIINRPLQTAG